MTLAFYLFILTLSSLLNRCAGQLPALSSPHATESVDTTVFTSWLWSTFTTWGNSQWLTSTRSINAIWHVTRTKDVSTETASSSSTSCSTSTSASNIKSWEYWTSSQPFLSDRKSTSSTTCSTNSSSSLVEGSSIDVSTSTISRASTSHSSAKSTASSDDASQNASGSASPTATQKSLMPVVSIITLTSEVTNYISQADGSTLTQSSTITPVVETLLTLSEANQRSTTSASSPSSNLTSSSATRSLPAASSTSLLSSSSLSSSLFSSSGSSIRSSTTRSSTGTSSEDTTNETSTNSASSSSTFELSSGLVTENEQTYTVIVTVLTEVSLTYSQTRLQPLISDTVSTQSAVFGATSTFSTASSTGSTPFMLPTGDFNNPLSHTTSCTFAPIWTSITLSYDPWCTESAGTRACLCPYCATHDLDCLGEPPMSGTCPAGWLCDVTIPASGSTAAWVTPSDGPGIPSSWSIWDRYTTCVAAENQKSCSSVTYTAQLSTSTSTDSNGIIWAFGVRWWSCPDALCNASNFIVKSFNCLLHFHCWGLLFQGFPKAPELIFPPINPSQPPELGEQTRPHSIGTVKPNNRVTPTQDPADSPTTSTQTQSSGSSMCSDESTFTYTTKYCSKISIVDSSTIMGCSYAITTRVGCTGTGSITTSTLSCSSGIQTGYIVDCPANFTANADCWTNTTYTFNGCSATTSTSVLACSLESVNYNDPAIASTLSAWLSMFTFTIPLMYTTVSSGVTLTLSYSSSTSSVTTVSGSTSSSSRTSTSSTPTSSVNSTSSSLTIGESSPTTRPPTTTYMNSSPSTVPFETPKPATTSFISTSTYSLPPDTELQNSFSSWESSQSASQASSVASARASDIAFDQRTYPDSHRDYWTEDYDFNYYCEDERARSVGEIAYTFKLSRGKEDSDWARMRNAACWYLWEKEDFDTKKAYYFDWTVVSSTFHYAPAAQFHNVTFMVWYAGTDDHKWDSKWWTYDGDYDYPKRCIDGFNHAVQHCDCKGDECGGDDMSWGGGSQRDLEVYKVAAFPRSPSYFYPLMGSGNEDLYLPPHDSP